MNRFCLYSILLVATGVQAQQKITFFNKGQLCIENSLYIKGDFWAGDTSKVCQSGITSLTGDFINDIKTGHVFTTDAGQNKGTFEFCGTSRQEIKGAAPKERYINFPDTLRINNQATADSVVLMRPAMAATTKIVDIRRGRLILDSEAGSNHSVNAHLLVEKDVISHPNAIQVNLDLGDNYQKNKLAGFTPPFEKLYADYFFFNFLSRPTAKGLFGNDGRLITSPLTPLNPGMGYIVGMGIIPDGDPYFQTEIDPRWAGIDPGKRVKNKFHFSRNKDNPPFIKDLSDGVTPGYVTGEKLVLEDIRNIYLDRGFNYLGNPYMAPLDLSDIIKGSTSADWGVPDNTLKKGFYVLSQGTGSYANAKLSFSASYLISQEQGSTHNARSVAPMQMFIVGTETPVAITIPKNKRQHNSSATFLRSAHYEITDELLLETTDHETGGYDRICIVFRNNATMQSADPFDAEKIFNRSGGVNQIYTRSADGKDMTVAVLPPSTGKLPLYFVPALLPQQVTLKADRLNSLLSVGYVVLEDTKTGTLTNLMQTPSYTFAAAPSDKTDRFVLHFTSTPATGTGNASLPEKPYAIYRDGVVRIYGLKESDRGSDVSLFNMQGRLMHRQPLEETAPCLMPKRLPQGIYIVRNNAAVIKFSVK